MFPFRGCPGWAKSDDQSGPIQASELIGYICFLGFFIFMLETKLGFCKAMWNWLSGRERRKAGPPQGTQRQKAQRKNVLTRGLARLESKDREQGGS